MKKLKYSLMICFVGIFCCQFFAQVRSASVPLGGHLTDAAVDPTAGRIYVITESRKIGYVYDDGTPTLYFSFDPEALTGKKYSRAFAQAVGVHPSGGAAVFWAAIDLKGIKSAYVTSWDTRRSVELSIAIGFATRLAVTKDGYIYVLGLVQGQKPQAIVHCFSPTGNYIQSFSDLSVASPGEMGIARLIAIGNSIFAIAPTVSNKVFEYAGGKLSHVYSFDGIGADDTQVMSIGPGQDSESCIVQLIGGNQKEVAAKGITSSGTSVSLPGRGIADPVFYMLKIMDGGRELISQEKSTPGVFFGLTRSGASVFKDAGPSASAVRIIR